MDKDVQFWIVIGIIIIALALIVVTSLFVLRVRTVNMRSHHKVQALALLGLTAVAIIALIVGMAFTDRLDSLIGVAGAAVGGIAGFISHKMTAPNRTVLFPIKDEHVKAGDTLKFSVAGISTAGYNLNYSMSSSPELPEGANLNAINGEFSWTPGEEEGGNEYNVTFTVIDGQGGTDSRTIKIIVDKKDQSQT